MRPRPSQEGMELLRPIVFFDALLRLQAMLGDHVKVTVNEYGIFFGCGFEGTLKKVEAMPGSTAGICVVLDAGAGFFLDPEDCEAMLVDCGEIWWLEFHRPVGPVLAIQPAEKPREEVPGAAGK